MECVVCGGTNFIKDSGFYFCGECQTQSQELKEHAFQEEATQVNVKSAKKVKNIKTSKNEHLTSWECYNVILLALTEQLIQLGADVKIKKIVKCLWMRYLEKLEVINLEQDELPKLPLVHIKRDVRITYDVKKTYKRKRSVTSNSDKSETASRRQRSQKKAALAKSQYTEILEKGEDSKSLQAETLTSLKSSSEKSSGNEEIEFNKYSRKELRKMMKKNHLDSHKKDLESNLKCHKFTHRSKWSTKYKRGVYFISPIKIYAILYISLLIKKDSIQLGDLFRFLKEGHLNYDRFSTLFPESYSDKTFSFHDYGNTRFFSTKQFRSTVSQLVTFLGVEEYIKCPDLVELVQRYCMEMNLPDEVLNAVQNILSRNPMEFGKNRKDRRTFYLPNYEARVMSLIIFVLKLLYGLDGVTENNLTTYAQLCKTEFPDLNMFNIHNWMKWIHYRNHVISEYHFPTSQMNNTDVNVDLFLQYKQSHNIFINNRNKLISDMEGYKNLLTKIQDLQMNNIPDIQYPASLTPFNDHLNVIKNIPNRKELKEMLNNNFKNHSIDYLLHPKKYLKRINENVTIRHSGRNVNCVLEQIKNQIDYIRVIHKNEAKLLWAQILVADTDIPTDLEDDQLEKNTYTLQNAPPAASSGDVYDINYKPFETHWLYSRENIDSASKQHFSEYFDKFSDSFKFILNECSKIIELNNREMFVEFQNTELYLIYCGNYKYAKKRRDLHDLPPLIRQAEDDW